MRIDKFLNSVNITKRRAISSDMCNNGIVSVNNVVVKSAKQVKIGDIISIKFLNYEENYEILDLPKNKNIPKSDKFKFVRQIC